ncbi:helix-turn-helix domain-containing protein [Sphingomonas melonis]|uniref:HTH cro/C1-type domain-containing protein n=1 Tax=Sphingomonas melonis TaxID=152682 RepID=A0A7Y9FKN4_9SPHN|nr:helix-turn-helix transcriptional regulator [Sphingomonas melonis]NYD88888.1 hypothetical protein [Sphingomonas melonis]
MTSPDDHPHDRLRSARERAGFESAAEAARAFGWPESRYRHHENGTRGIPLKHAEAYGRAYKVSPAWIVGFKTEQGLSTREKLQASLLTLDEILSIKDIDEAILDKFNIALIPKLTTSRLSGFKAVAQDPYEPLIMDKSLIKSLVPDLRKINLRLQAVEIDSDLEWSTLKKGSTIIIDRRYSPDPMSDHLWLVGFDSGMSVCPIDAEGEDILILNADKETVHRASKAALEVWGRVVWMGGPSGTFGIAK